MRGGRTGARRGAIFTERRKYKSLVRIAVVPHFDLTQPSIESVYGSGYPGVVGSGVAGRNFPYVYPPVIWVDYGYGPHYLHSAHEVRPSGPLTDCDVE